MTVEDAFIAERDFLLKNPDCLIQLEYKYSNFLMDRVIFKIADDLSRDFTVNAKELLPFWVNYPPEQRGRQPTGLSIPWIEVGEKTISAHLIKKLSEELPEIEFPGLPTGGDIRFTTSDAFIHLDVKLTGPNDNPDEVVVPPNQVSGNGSSWENNGVKNSSWPIYYQSRQPRKLNYNFQPKLPPLYILNGSVLPCLTFFLKAVYGIDGYGIHPLRHFELACVPNGLLFFEGAKTALTEGLIIAGKDEKTKAEDVLRIRIRLTPLARINDWRSIKLVFEEGNWVKKSRITSTQLPLIE